MMNDEKYQLVLWEISYTNLSVVYYMIEKTFIKIIYPVT